MRSIVLLFLCSCATQSLGGSGPSPEPEVAPPRARTAEVVATGEVEVAAADVDGLVHAVRARVLSAGGHVLNEDLTGAARDQPRATLRLRLPPPEVPPFVDWLATRGQVLARHLAARDVSRAYLDEELALHNLRTTLERLEDIAAQGAKLADILALEKEMSRVRGEIERLEGSHRALGDQVALATIDLTITPADEALAPRVMFQLVPSATVLALADSRGREAVRVGAELTLMFSRHASLELQLFPARGGTRSALLTFHGAVYSDIFGGGRRRLLNPYVGLLAGGGSLDGHGAFSAGAVLGVELYRSPRLLVDLSARAQGLFYGEGGPPSDLVAQAGLGMGVPF
jgi:hypothetical protein